MNQKNIRLIAVATTLIVLVFIPVFALAPEEVFANHEYAHYDGNYDHDYWSKHKGHTHGYQEYCPWWDGEQEHEPEDEYIWPEVSCTVSNTNPGIGQTVVYTANTSFGEGPFTHDWIGDFAGSNQSENVIYNKNGRYSEVIEITDGRGNTSFDTCPLVIVDETPVDNLSVSCRVSDISVEEDERVTFTADVSGGVGSYIYKWFGDISGDGRIEDVEFDEEGDYDVHIEVTDSKGNTATNSCRIVEVEEEEDDDFDVSCRVSDTSVRVGEEVTFTADVDGGNSPYEYDWNGDISGDDRREDVEFNREGRYEVEITVEDDDGNDVSDDCPTVYVEDDDFVAGPANVDSVYLSQVPYTGPEDTFKVIGYFLILLALSIVAVYFVARKKLAMKHSNIIEMFKNRNKLSKKIN